MKPSFIILASFLTWLPASYSHAQNPTPNTKDYAYVVTSADSVKMTGEAFSIVTIDCNREFAVKSNQSWIKAQKSGKNSVLIVCQKNDGTTERTGSVSVTATDGKILKDIVVVQQLNDNGVLIPENTGVAAPVMGWKSNHDGKLMESFLLKQTAAMQHLGLRAKGYEYVVLDKTTFNGRDQQGKLTTDAAQFPSGLTTVMGQVNAAFKTGIQTAAEQDLDANFGKGLGLKGHEGKDFNYWFNELGMHHVQVDFTSINREQVEGLSQTLKANSNGNVVLDINSGTYPGTWIQTAAPSWHTAQAGKDWKSVAAAIQANRFLSAYAGNGYYHNMGAIEVNHQLTAEEEKSYIGLWCMFNSPLLLQGDLEKMSAHTLALLKNQHLIDLNQKATFQQAYVSQYTNGCYVWVKDINKDKKTSRAIAVYNAGEQAQQIMVSMDQLDLNGSIRVCDAIAGKDLGVAEGQMAVDVPAHGTRIYLLGANGRLERRVYEAENGYIPSFEGGKLSAHARYVDDAHCSGGAMVEGLGNHADNALIWKQVESEKGGLYHATISYLSDQKHEVTVTINGKNAQTIEVVPSGKEQTGTFTFMAELNPGENTIALSNAKDKMPAIDVMHLRPAQSAAVLVEAENFNLKGGWKVDQQFMDIMGSPYLNAHGMGVPVADATTEIEIPSNNTYHIYARTYNWVAPWTTKEGPGKFQLGVDGKKMESVLGCTGNQWEWQYAGSINLTAGKHALSLHDLTGFNGRVDAIYFNTEKVAPPADVKALGNFRRTQLNIPNTPEVQKEFDLVVCGAGIAGMCTAMAAAREGMKVALINDRPVVGGNNSAEVRVHLGGRIELPPYTNLGNLIKEFGHTKVGNAMPASNYEDDRKMAWIRSEKNISLFLNNRVNQVHMADDQIDYVISQNTETGERTLYKAPLFVDCTGDGTIGALAGADFRMGRESKHEFNESKGPEKADSMTMGNSDQWYAIDTPAPSAFPIFEYGVVFNEQNREAISKGDWNWENGMHQNQITEFERIRDYGLMVVYSNWSFLKNKYSQKAKFANKKLEWVAYIGGKRESRRLMGDYILNGNDIVNHKVQPDFTASTSWSIDLHYPVDKNEQAFNGEAFKSWADHLSVYSYPIPYRCLYSRNVNNLFMAGRNISVTHMALGTTRVMRTTGMIGEVVGLAASVCWKHNALPRDVYEFHFEDLKQLMTKGAGKQGLPNNQTFNNGSWLNN